MKTIGSIILILFLSLVVFSGCAVTAAPSYPAEGQAMPEFQLPVPKSQDLVDYLGLKAGATFQLSDITAEIVVVEIFSMYCPYCQREAPIVNQFYELVEKNPEARKRIRMLGIGVSNSDYEVRVFQKQYEIPFPLIPDPDLMVHQKVGGVRTPHFFVLKSYPDGSRKLIYSQSGGFGDPEAFLNRLLQASD